MGTVQVVGRIHNQWIYVEDTLGLMVEVHHRGLYLVQGPADGLSAVHCMGLDSAQEQESMDWVHIHRLGAIKHNSIKLVLFIRSNSRFSPLN